MGESWPRRKWPRRNMLRMCCGCFRETKKARFVIISPLRRCHALSSMYQFWCRFSHVVELIIHAIIELNQFKRFAVTRGHRTFSIVLSYRPYSIVSTNVLTQCDVTADSSTCPHDITLWALTERRGVKLLSPVAPSFVFLASNALTDPQWGYIARWISIILPWIQHKVCTYAVKLS